MAGKKKILNKDSSLNAYGEEVVDWMERRLRVAASMTDELRVTDVWDFAKYPGEKRFNISDNDANYLSNIATRRAIGQAPVALMPNYKERPPIMLALDELDDGYQFSTEAERGQ
jgi:hypothetical protein